MAELRSLDLRLRLAFLDFRQQPSHPLDHLKGLVLTEEEIESLTAPAACDRLESNCSELKILIQTIKNSTAELRARQVASLRNGSYMALPDVAAAFGLNWFEQQCLLLCLAPEIDRKYDKVYAFLQDDVTRKRPGIDLALKLFCVTPQEKVEARSSFAAGAPLLKHHLIEISEPSLDSPSPLLSKFLKLDDRVAAFILGSDQIDLRLASLAHVTAPQMGWDDLILDDHSKQAASDFVRSNALAATAGYGKPVMHLHAPAGAGKRTFAECVCRDLGLSLLCANTSKMIGHTLSFEEVLRLLCREATLQRAALCLDNFDALVSGDVSANDALRSLFAVAAEHPDTEWFLLGETPWRPRGLDAERPFLSMAIATPGASTRQELWNRYLNGSVAPDAKPEVTAVAGKFRLNPGQVRNAVQTAMDLARSRADDHGVIRTQDLYAACRLQSNQKLNGLARKIDPKHTWSDIVLPEDSLAQLREICQRVEHRDRVLEQWGFDCKLSMGKGVNALFAGPSGTGKTMAAEVIANSLGLELYKIDLSQIVSKYIGETEKNLSAVFAAAENSNSVLALDECEAILGKRSEVRDSHDRYANIEISYLLQKMEEYEGVSILTTNLLANLDDAFVRRLAFTVHFPFPDETFRQRIWAGIWPEQTPRAGDLDLGFLARQFKLSGGNIRNIALAASFLAAEDGGIVTMAHVLQATRREFQKMGKALAVEETNAGRSPMRSNRGNVHEHNVQSESW
ncbi:MAG TPA: AAA family ATPase [Verrucomicrobiae bacterium]|nr:AAA family ATPase [Verrucomicrobiae bacterium]